MCALTPPPNPNISMAVKVGATQSVYESLIIVCSYNYAIISDNFGLHGQRFQDLANLDQLSIDTVTPRSDTL